MNIDSIPTNLYSEATKLFKPNRTPTPMYEMLYDLYFFPKQLKDAWEFSKEKITPDMLGRLKEKRIKNIVCAGMGGSNVGDFLQAFDAKVPFVSVKGYELPYFTNSSSLVFITSYSGGTEETISCLCDAVFKDANIFIISRGNLIKCIEYYNHLFKEKKIPYLVLQPNTSLPRVSLGLLLAPILYILDKLGTLSYDNKVQELIKNIDNIATIERKQNEWISNTIGKCEKTHERFKELVGQEALSIKEIYDFIFKLEKHKKEIEKSNREAVQKLLAGRELELDIFKTSNFLIYERKNIIKTAQIIANISYMTNSSLCIHLPSDHYKGLVSRIQNQFSENAKTAVNVVYLPEECHNSIEYLDKNFNIFIKDEMVLKRDILRRELVKNIAKKELQQSFNLQGIISNRNEPELEALLEIIKNGYIEIELHGRKHFEKLLETDYIFAWASFYLGLLNGYDPSYCPTIKNIKSKLDDEILEKFQKRIFYLLLPDGCIPRS